MILEYVGLVFEFIGMLLNAHKNKWCWPMFFIGDILFLIYSIVIVDTGFVIIWSMFLVSNIYGWHKWRESV